MSRSISLWPLALWLTAAACGGARRPAPAQKPQTPEEKTFSRADVLYLQDGQELLGELRELGNRGIHFKRLKGEALEVELPNVLKIQLAPPAGPGGAPAGLDPELVELIQTAPAPDDMPDYNWVDLLLEYEYTELDDGSIRLHWRRVQKILNDKGKSIASRNDQYLPEWEEFKIIRARSIAPDGSVAGAVHTAAKEVYTQTRHEAYRRDKKVLFEVPNAEVGSVIETVVEVTGKTDDLERPWEQTLDFSVGYPRLRMRVILDRQEPSGLLVAEENIDRFSEAARLLQAGKLVYKIPPTWELKKTTNRDQGRVRTVWEAGPLPVVQHEPYTVDKYEHHPRLRISRKRTWAQTARDWHQAALPRMKLGRDTAAFATEHTQDKPPLAAARSLYNALVYRIRRVPVRSDEYSFLPHAADEIFKNGYANDWDKTFLYYAMLKHAGLDVRLLAGRFWYWNWWEESPPCLERFDYLVVHIKDGDQEAWVRCGKDQMSFGVLGSLWGGRTLELSGGSGKLGWLPAPRPDQTTGTYSMRIKVKADGNARVEERREWSDYPARYFRFLWRFPPIYLHKYMEYQLRKRIYNAVLEDFKISDHKNLDEPVWHELTYRLEPLDAINAGRYIAYHLPGTNYQPVKAQEIDRRGDISLGGPSVHIYRFEITCEPGIRIAAAPDPVQQDTGWGLFTRKTEFRPDKSLLIEDRHVIRQRRLPAKRYQEFVDFYDRNQRAGRQRVILELTGDKSSPWPEGKPAGYRSPPNSVRRPF